MNREKRIELVKAMSVIMEALSDEDVYDMAVTAIPEREELEERLDTYITDTALADMMDMFQRMVGKAAETGYWCDGISSEKAMYKDSDLRIKSARKIPIHPSQIVFNRDTRWIISGTFKGMPFLANGQQALRTESLLEDDDLLDSRKRWGDSFSATDERMLLKMLAEKLKGGAVEGLTPEEAETMEANWKGNDWKGKEW